MRRCFLHKASALAVLLAGCGSAWAEDFAFFHENVMGTSLELRVRADSAEDAATAEARVLGEIDRLTKVFSGYDSSSEFSRWQATVNRPTALSTELLDVLAQSDAWRSASGGAFDPRVQAMTELWEAAAAKNRLPTAESLARIKALMARPAWRLDEKGGTAERLTACPISLNAIAKGAIVEFASDAAFRDRAGVRGLLLNIGGDLRVRGEMEAVVGVGSPWKDSETTEPIDRIRVRNRAVATSGDYHRGARIGGKWYSHIFDPRTGRPASGISSATVIAERSADADALATIFNVLTPAESLKLIGTVPNAECLIVESSGKRWQSGGWNAYQAVALATSAQASSPKAAATAKSGWGADHELEIKFEINSAESKTRSYRRPYVAVWVEDEQGKVVRNLIVWVSMGGAGPDRWLPDLKRWYKAERARRDIDGTDTVHTIGRSTRPPGEYSVVWNGLDDDKQPVPPGKYTIFIETAREHGTHQSIRKEVTLADKPFSEELKGNVEIRSAAVEYRPKTPDRAAAK
jgi:thiamine biosynthesis lipoprotein ApbE